MNNGFEDDELLSKLREAASEHKAPRLSDTLIYSVTDIELRNSPMKLATPGRLVSLLGGFALLFGAFLSTSQGATIDISEDHLDRVLSGVIQGDLEISEIDLLVRNAESLPELGQTAIGNYISNRPKEYVDEIWKGQGGYNSGKVWVFVVTDKVHFPNSSDLSTMFSEASLRKYSNEIASQSDADGIRLLIQGSNEKLYPLVIPVSSQPGSLYSKVLEKIESNTFSNIQ
jgi:hypothetical protein